MQLTIYMKKPSWHTPIVLVQYKRVDLFLTLLDPTKNQNVVRFQSDIVPIIHNSKEFVAWCALYSLVTNAKATAIFIVAKEDYYYELKPE